MKQAIYGPGADLGDDDVMKSNETNAVLVRQMVKDLSQHVQLQTRNKKNLIICHSRKTPPVYTAEINQQCKQGAKGLRIAEPPDNF